MGFFSNAKDRAMAGAALSYLNSNLIAPYGRATSLNIDSTAKTISIEVELKGESAPVQIELTDYEISKEGERYFATVQSIRTSREWLTAFTNDRLCKNRFEIPAPAGQWLLRVL